MANNHISQNVKLEEAILPSSGNSWGWCRAPRSWRTCRRAEWRQRSGYGSTPGPPPPQRIPHQRAELRRAAETGRGGKRWIHYAHTGSHIRIHTHAHLSLRGHFIDFHSPKPWPHPNLHSHLTHNLHQDSRDIIVPYSSLGLAFGPREDCGPQQGQYQTHT